MVHLPKMKPAPPLIDPGRMTAFVDPLPVPEVAKPLGKRLNSARKAQVPFYRIPIQEFFSKVHRDVPPTRFWGFGNSMPGPTIEARGGEEILVEWPNELPAKHFLPIDHSIMGAEKGRPESRTVVHVHGARVPPESDGWPEAWYAPGKSATYHYPNNQDAALLWYHDHAMGINRLNVCAGMAGLYVIRDSFEDALNLPKDEFEIPLVLMDRMIGTDGQIYYPVSQFPDAPWIPEYTGNATLINGKVLPYFDVQPRQYRFRILNASNSRFYYLSLGNDQPFQQIGTDQGLLSAPVPVARLAIAPGERADVVVDFAEHRGQRILLNSLVVTVMQFRVAPEAVADPSSLPSTIRPIPAIVATDAIRTGQLTAPRKWTTCSVILWFTYWTESIGTILFRKSRCSARPRSGTCWNLTDDSHPIHLHLVRFHAYSTAGRSMSTRGFTTTKLFIPAMPCRRSQMKQAGKIP